jgi:O-antigen/teichoic acid export membrane protein
MFKKRDISTFGKTLIKFASSQIISNFLRIVSGFLVVRMLDPEQFGEFTGVGIYLGYFALGHLGVINGLGREFPFQFGKGNDKYGKQLSNSTYTVTAIIALLTSVFFLFLSIYNFFEGYSLQGVVFLSYVIIGGLNLFNTQLLPALYRTSSDFGLLSKINMTVGIWNFLSVGLVWLLGFWGLLIRGVFLAILQAWLLFRRKPYPLKLQLFKNDLQHLFKIGFPIFLVGQVNPLWGTIVNNIIFTLGGAKFFGLYALANIVQSSMMVIPNSFGQVIYPRMSIMYGEGKTPKEIISLNIKPLFFQFIVLLTVSIIGAFLLPIVIPWLLPKYTAGIEAAQWMMFVPVVLSFGAINNIFNVTRQQKIYFLALLSGAMVGTLYIILKIKLIGLDLLVFPQGLILGKLFQQLLAIFFAFRRKL